MPLVGIGACVSLQFAGLAACKNYFKAQNARSGKLNPADLTPSQLYLAGAGGGILNSVVSGPVEHIRIRKRHLAEKRAKHVLKCSFFAISQVCRLRHELQVLSTSMGLGMLARKYTPQTAYAVSTMAKGLPSFERFMPMDAISLLMK
jgi:hypothetical protein